MIRVDLYHQPSNTKTVWFSKRNFRKLNLSCFIKELQVMPCCLSPENNADYYAEQIRSSIATVLNHLAPIQKYSMRLCKHDDKWLSSDAKNKKIRRHKLEHYYRKAGSLSDKKLYRTACREAAAAILKSRCSHYQAKLNSAYDDQKETWKIAKKFLHSNSSKTNNTIPEAKCDITSQYFIRKLKVIKNTIQERLAKAPISKFISELSPPVDILTTFGTVTPTDVSKIIKTLKPKTSPLDIIPTNILKSRSEIFCPIIAHLADLSFKFGIFPTLYKVAQISPIPKKSGLLALSSLRPYLTSSVNFNPLHSGFKSYHSSETALLKICNDILLNIDDGLTTISLSLDISSPFDTIDHSLLITRIKNEFGVTDIALKWLTSYLHSQKSFVSIGSSNSRLIASSTGVRQGSTYLLRFHHKDNINKITECANAVTTWFLENGLLLNPNKIEAILFGSTKQTSKYKNDSNIAFSGTTITIINSVKILGVTLDSKLSMDKHINNTST
ncbi:uncharacterized protein LOC124815040 [Hydra vulgaris]|uniref:uncharacterized protein LOC124815040 n=1 Tax=Hydra vulgaris TaxID=6087 RepID=UPI001F5E914B|nr:uncharacterized protein LOC124815040 [Hydra vulgaris]